MWLLQNCNRKGIDMRKNEITKFFRKKKKLVIHQSYQCCFLLITGRVRLTFLANAGKEVVKGPHVVSVLRHQVMSESSELLDLPLLFVDTVVCQNNCSGILYYEYENHLCTIEFRFFFFLVVITRLGNTEYEEHGYLWLKWLCDVNEIMIDFREKGCNEIVCHNFRSWWMHSGNSRVSLPQLVDGVLRQTSYGRWCSKLWYVIMW